MPYLLLLLAAANHPSLNLEIAIAWVALVVALVLAILLLVTPVWALVLYVSLLLKKEAEPSSTAGIMPLRSSESDAVFRGRLTPIRIFPDDPSQVERRDPFTVYGPPRLIRLPPQRSSRRHRMPLVP